MSKKVSLKPQSFVVKSNLLIEARYRLSLQEAQVVLWLLTQINSEDEDFKVHRMDIIDFSRMINVEADNQYSKLRSVTKNLMRRVLEIYEPERQEYLQVAWLSSARYLTRTGVILLKFDPELKPYLLQLKHHFTKISIADMLKLKSVYAIRIFELLLQYIQIGTRKISVEDLRLYCGIEREQYKNYFDFKRKILEKSTLEINTKTEYEINYTEIKESRRVIAIEWKINKKSRSEDSQKLLNLRNELRSSLSLIESLVEYGFSRSIAKKLLQNNEERVVRDALRAVDIQVARGKVKNPKAMLQTAIIEQWHPEVFREKKKLL